MIVFCENYSKNTKKLDKLFSSFSNTVDGKFKEVSSNNNKLSISSVAVLSALNIADELFKCNNEVEDLLKEKNSLEERNLTLKERIREIKQEVEETIKNKNQEMASLKEMLYSMEQKSREAEILNDKVADLTEELEEKSKLEELVVLLKENMAVLKKSGDFSVIGDVHVLCCRMFRQPWHRQNIPRQRNNKACSGRKPDFTDRNPKS